MAIETKRISLEEFQPDAYVEIKTKVPWGFTRELQKNEANKTDDWGVLFLTLVKYIFVSWNIKTLAGINLANPPKSVLPEHIDEIESEIVDFLMGRVNKELMGKAPETETVVTEGVTTPTTTTST